MREVLENFKNIFEKKMFWSFLRKYFKEYAFKTLKVFKKFHEKYVWIFSKDVELT
jgi:hypothetical protein